MSHLALLLGALSPRKQSSSAHSRKRAIIDTPAEHGIPNKRNTNRVLRRKMLDFRQKTDFGKTVFSENDVNDTQRTIKQGARKNGMSLSWKKSNRLSIFP